MKKAILLILFLCILMSGPSVAYADSEITVKGTGTVLVPADAAIVSLGVSMTDADVLEAQAKTNDRIASIRTSLIAAGLSEDDISTDYINIYAMYDYSGGREELTSYNATSTLTVRVDEIERAGEVIDAAFRAGANTLNGISFSASDTKEAREKALRAAVEDARATAEILADAAGLRILGIEDIIEGDIISGGAVNNSYRQDAMEASSDTVVQAAKLTVRVNVTVTFKADR